MKNLIQKVQALGRKAGEMRAAVQSAPGKAAELRKALTLTAGEFHQLRADVQSNATGLLAQDEDHLLRAMREINDRTEAFEDAGYELTGMDLDLTLNQRLAVHLRKFGEVSQSTLRQLAAKETTPTTKSIFAGIINAEETAANVELTHLKFDGLIIHIGAQPLVRICWSSDTLAEEVESQLAAASPSIAPAPTVPPNPTQLGSFFEPRQPSASPHLPATVEETVRIAPVTPQALKLESQPKETAPQTSPWSKEALDRFKKMPDLSKHRG